MAQRQLNCWRQATKDDGGAMHKSIISLIILCCSAAGVLAATTADLADGAPDRYVVVQGDTLWSIAGRFLKSPWKWNEIWKLNHDQIKNPHRIYPGDVVVLDKSALDLRLSLLKGNVVKLSPQTLSSSLESEPVPTIPTADIEPFLSKPLVVAENQLASAARIVRTQESRVALGAGNIAYVKGITKEQGVFWQIFRPGPVLVDPDSKESLGREAIYLGDAKVEKFGDVSTVEIVKSPLEIYAGDYLIQAPREVLLENYVPRAPGKKIDARIIAAYGGLYEIGNNAIVTLSKGSRDWRYTATSTPPLTSCGKARFSAAKALCMTKRTRAPTMSTSRWVIAILRCGAASGPTPENTRKIRSRWRPRPYPTNAMVSCLCSESSIVRHTL